jgi:uncharacterized Zn-binding protein involved in type VI secretion
MPGQGRLGDKAYVSRDIHGCPFCPHPGTGPAISGSFDVFVNKRPALRVGDPGIHAACCGKNTWLAKTGSETVFINGKAAHRQTDQTTHCGGNGQLVEGSPNVIVGDTTVSPAGGPSSSASSSSGASSNSSASSSSAGSPSGGASSSGDASSSGSTSLSDESNAAAAQDSEPPPAADPADPIEPGIDPDPATLHAQAQADVLRAAAAAHIPFCEECERARTGSQP